MTKELSSIEISSPTHNLIKMSIVVKNRNGEFCFSLNNINQKGFEHLFIEYEFLLKIEGFETRQVLQAEVYDLQDLLKGFTYLHENLKGTFFFEPMINSQVKIKFEMTDQGNIIIDGQVSNPLHSTKLSFRFGSDQTFLPDLISQCKMTINSLKES